MGEELEDPLRELRTQLLESRSTSAQERRTFFLGLLRSAHPDKNLGAQEESTKRFQFLQEEGRWFLKERDVLNNNIFFAVSSWSYFAHRS